MNNQSPPDVSVVAVQALGPRLPAAPRPAASASPFALPEIGYLVFRRKWAILPALLLAAAAAVAMYLLTPTVYPSHAKLLVRYVQESTPIDPETFGARMLSPESRGTGLINTETEILSSMALAEAVVKRLGLTELGPELSEEGAGTVWARMLRVLGLQGGSTNRVSDVQAAGSRLLGRLEVVNPRNSSVIRLTYRGNHNGLAPQILNTWIELYLLRHAEIHRTQGSFAFLGKTTDELRGRLLQTEEELRNLKNSIGGSNVEEAKALLARRAEELQMEKRNTEANLAAGRAKVAVLQERAAVQGVPPVEAAAPPATTLRGRLLQERLKVLRAREIDMMSTYTTSSLPIQSVRSEIVALESAIVRETTPDEATNAVPLTAAQFVAPLDPAGTEQANVAAMEAKLEVLDEQERALLERINRVNSLEERFVQLQRTKELEESSYRAFARNLEQARIDQELDISKISNISIVEPATRSGGIRLNLGRNIGIVLALGLLAGLGVAFVQEHVLDHSLRRRSHAEQDLGVPVLVTIPYFSRLHRRRGGGSEAAAAVRSFCPAPLMPYLDSLRDRLNMLWDPGARRPLLIGVLGCGDDVGARTVARGLALSLARGDGRTMLVDAAPADGDASSASFAQPRLSDIFTDKNDRTQILQPNVMQLTDDPEEQEEEESASKLSADRDVMSLLQKLRQSDEYSSAVFHLPQAHETSPSLRVLNQLDAVVCVVAEERVSRHAVRTAGNLLAAGRAPLVGVVYNMKRRYIPEWVGVID